MRKSFKPPVKPLSNTQIKKKQQQLYKELSGVTPDYTCCVCNIEIHGRGELIKHLEGHPIQDWDWSLNYRVTSDDTSDIDISSYSRGMIKSKQLIGSFIDKITSDNTRLLST